jgi:hypothetical protein
MEISVAERRIVQLSVLLKCQLRLIENLKERGKDLTAARNVFDCLRVGFFLAAQDWHRALCYGEQKGQNNSPLPPMRWGSKSGLYVPSLLSDLAKWTGSQTLEARKTADPATKHKPNTTSDAVGTEPDSTPSADAFGFRPLTQDEKKDFENSLDAEVKRTLEENSGEEIRRALWKSKMAFKLRTSK